MFFNPEIIVADSHSNLFVWEYNNHRIRKITPDTIVTTFAGGGNQNTGVGTNVDLSGVNFTGMTIDHNDTIWMVGDPNYNYLYKITSDAVITRTNLSLSDPRGICADSFGSLYISAAGRIYKYNTNGVLTVFAGSGNPGYADGNGIFTSFYLPGSVTADAADNIYVFDSGNHLIRRIDQNQNVTTFAGQYNYGGNGIDGVGTNAAFNNIAQMCFDDSGNLILACGGSVRKVSATIDNIFTEHSSTLIDNTFINSIN